MKDGNHISSREHKLQGPSGRGYRRAGGLQKDLHDANATSFETAHFVAGKLERGASKKQRFVFLLTRANTRSVDKNNSSRNNACDEHEKPAGQPANL